MSTLVGLQESRVQWERPIAKPLDEVMWQTWVAKGVNEIAAVASRAGRP
jgi:hypothetical protein